MYRSASPRTPRRSGTPTTGRSRTPKKTRPLLRPQVKVLQEQVERLQREADHQLSLEYESQQAFEYLHGQQKQLRQAFASLSDALVDELENLKNSQTRRVAEAERRATTAEETAKAALAKVEQLSALGVAKRQDLDEIENRLLKRIRDVEEGSTPATTTPLMDASTARINDRLEELSTRIEGDRDTRITNLQADVSSLRQVVDQVRRDQATAIQATASDIQEAFRAANNLETAVGDLSAKTQHTYDVSQATAHQITQLTEAADVLATEQKALRKRCGEAGNAAKEAGSKVSGLEKSVFEDVTQMMEKIQSLGVEMNSLRQSVNGTLQRADEDTRKRFDAVSHAISVFSELMQISSPLDNE